ncbi:hypothetical protein [Myxococcus sp. SDU36]|uniref:hypothetical protein n=1 Tax=Myxococcus sp. SDU36 TaxID=2831967 RepID=UPI002543983A|nr:hypothetical protein [Myxococcus sp. SDU36]WIG94425.1 hypothetical protein KGD87_28395 [Myxococcus sp. SDU36]
MTTRVPNKIGILSLLGCLLLSACSEPEQIQQPQHHNTTEQQLTTPKARVLGISSWVGYYRARSASSGVSSELTTTLTWSANLTYTAPVRLTLIGFSGIGYAQIGPGFANFEKNEEITFQGIPVSTTTARCADTVPAFNASMTFPSDSTYSFHPFGAFTSRTCKGTITQSGTSADGDIFWYGYPNATAASLFTFPLPAVTEELRLKGQRKFFTDGSTLIPSVPANPIPFGSTPVEWEIEWDLRPEATDVELHLTADNYDDWLPRGSSDFGSSLTGSEPPEPGSTIQVQAQVVAQGTVTPSVKQITFMLTSSQIPGTAMNSPPIPIPLFGESPKDLQFEPGKNATHGLTFISEEKVQTPIGEYTQARAEVSSYDFGSYGTIWAIGQTADDRFVVSRVTTSPLSPDVFTSSAEGALLLPKRAANSLVAEKWKQDENASTLSDSDDSDQLPNGKGDGHQGDGLTLYEEYRGFILEGQHTRTRPSEVDYFLHNDFGSTATSGIQLFQSLTGLKVRQLYGSEYLSSTRIINAHHAGVPHIVNQHLVVMKPILGLSFSETVGGPSTPQHIQYVGIGERTPADVLTSTVAHELAHSVNVPHHGEGGIFKAYWQTTVVDDVSVTIETPASPLGLNSGRVEIGYEPGTIFPLQSNLAFPAPDQLLNISAKCAEDGTQSVFSGAHDCIMRYHAQALIRAQPGGERHIRWMLSYNKAESPGTQLCTTSNGTGFNDIPESRHGVGSAASGRGDCAHKVCVSDKHNHPPRFGIPGPVQCTLMRNLQ